MARRAHVIQPLVIELADADLGDSRLSRRLTALASSLADRASEGFPKALDDAELE
nr:hypothetical protein [Deltaproteobacteria bacterium]